MKIKEVCLKTGLTEKAVRYYVENELCSPREYESRDRKYLDFADDNIAELKNIAVMRKLGFSIEDIRRMKIDGSSIEDVMSRYIRSLSEELDMKQRIFSALAFREYGEMHSLEDLMPTLSDILKPDPAAPDFSKFDSDLFDDGHEREFSEFKSAPIRIAKVEEIFINCAVVIGTMMALLTLPGILMFLGAAIIATLVFRKVQSDYMTLYKALSGIGFLANAAAFIRLIINTGGLARLSAVFSFGTSDFTSVQCRLYLLAAVAELISLLILSFGRDIQEHF